MKAIALAALALALGACGNKSRSSVPPQVQTPGTSLNLEATAATPSVHINARDGGATQLQIGNVQTQLPGENARAQAAEREAQEGQ